MVSSPPTIMPMVKDALIKSSHNVHEVMCVEHLLGHTYTILAKQHLNTLKHRVSNELWPVHSVAVLIANVHKTARPVLYVRHGLIHSIACEITYTTRWEKTSKWLMT